MRRENEDWDPQIVFTSEYRGSLINSEFTGADTSELMNMLTGIADILNGESTADVQPLLEEFASIRGRPLNEVQFEYEITKSVKAEARLKINSGIAPPIDNLHESQRDFMGSTWQLRSGKVVGDYYRVDPAFGALLNPTGGLVGAGNSGLDPRSPFIPESIAYHGAYHDAMGYLRRYHEVGPGYDYVGPTFDYWRELPIAGQVTGVAAWTVSLLGNAELAGGRY